MRSQTFLCGLTAALLAALGCSATPVIDPAPSHVQFQSKKLNAGLRYVNNSGVCETTPGVHTASGYIDIAQNQSLVSFFAFSVADAEDFTRLQWFWFFAARENPETAPFTLWSVVSFPLGRTSA
jgi:hypothetical protein